MLGKELQPDPAAPLDGRRVQAILDERTARLAARRDDAAKAEQPHARVLACAIGQEVYGIALHAVAEVLPARPPVPVVGAQLPVLGAIGLGGRMYSVVDLAAALGLRSGPPDNKQDSPGHLLRLNHMSRRMALRVDRAMAVISAVALPPDREPKTGMGGKAINGYALAPAGSITARETLIGLIDLDELLRPVLALPTASGA